MDIALKRNETSIPLFMAEMARGPVATGHFHKDFSKLALSMTLACRDSFKYQHSHKLDCTDVRVYGAFIDGSQIQFCVAHPFIELIDGQPKLRLISRSFDSRLLIKSFRSFDTF